MKGGGWRDEWMCGDVGEYVGKCLSIWCCRRISGDIRSHAGIYGGIMD